MPPMIASLIIVSSQFVGQFVGQCVGFLLTHEKDSFLALPFWL